jgi:acid phosphatase type 7
MKAMESMKFIKRGVSVLMGIGLAMLLSVLSWSSGGSVSAQVATDPVLVGAGDIASNNNADSATAALVRSIPGTVFTAGDNAYPSGTTADYTKYYGPTWGEFKPRTLPTPGNHDYDTPNAAGYFDYFGSAAGVSSEGYYSYDLGDPGEEWHVVALNSMCEKVGGCGATSPMVKWLKDDLAANSDKECTLAYFHHPLFSSGQHGNDPKMRPTWDALYAAGADVVISGHDHDYERFAPQRPDGTLDNALGIREFVVGTGGATLRSFSFIQPNSEVRNSNTQGVLKLTLHPSSYDWQFVPVAGQDFTDSSSGNCHDGPVPTSTATATTTATITALPKNGGPELMLPVTLVASLALIASGVGALVLLRRSL